MTPRPAQPTPGSGPPELDAGHAAEAGAQHVLQFEVFDGARFRGQMKDSLLGFRVQDQARGVGLGVAADDQDLLAHLGEGRDGILRRRRFSDSAFAVKRNLTKTAHGALLLQNPNLS